MSFSTSLLSNSSRQRVRFGHSVGRASFILVAFALSCLAPNVLADAQSESIPWDLDTLGVAPEYKWLDKDGPVRALTYAGESYRGKPTRVFAYYATPGTIAGNPEGDKNLPAMVLVHGGGGTAFKEWADLWAKRGYAAIAMDLGGCEPSGKRLPDGGPAQSDEFKFGAIDAPTEDQWSYHAVANVIRAHSLIRSFPEVDSDRTALTGISWGGYLTCMVSGLDHRFKASVPVYGCGFLRDNSAWLDRFAAMTPEQVDKWHRLWDPSRYVGSARMPMFFVNGTNDFAYPLDSYEKTYNLVKSPRNYRITINMPHGHPPGWNPKEIGLFIDQHLQNGIPLASIGLPQISEKEARASITSETEIESAQLCYTTDDNPMNKRMWKTMPAKCRNGKLTAKVPPAETTIWFFTATDKRDAIVSSPVVITSGMAPGQQGS